VVFGRSAIWVVLPISLGIPFAVCWLVGRQLSSSSCLIWAVRPTRSATYPAAAVVSGAQCQGFFGR